MSALRAPRGARDRIGRLALAAGLLLAAAAPTARAAAPTTAAVASTPKPGVSEPVALAVAPASGANLDDCLSCHHSLIDGRRAHMPLESGACTACHAPAVR